MQKKTQQNDFSNINIEAVKKMQKKVPLMPHNPVKTCIVCSNEIKKIERTFALTNNRDRICDSCMSTKIAEHLFRHKDVFSFRFHKDELAKEKIE